MATNANLKTKPTTWLDHVKTNEDSNGLNKIYNSLTDLFKFTPGDKLSHDARTKMLDSTVYLNVNTVLIMSPMDKYMMLIHQISKVGGYLLNPTLEYFGFTGCDTSTSPVRFTPKPILTINEVECPSWATIKTVKEPDTLTVERDITPSLSYFRSTIPIPPSYRPAVIPVSIRHVLLLRGSWCCI